MDLSRMSAGTLPAAPELLARLLTLQLVRSAELAFDSVVEIFRLLCSWQEIHSQMEAVNDIILYCYSVFDARNLTWFQQAIRTGLQIKTENHMPTMLEAMIERGVEKGLHQGLQQGLQQGMEKGEVIGRVRALQEICRQPMTPAAELALLTDEALQTLVLQLKKQLGDLNVI